jgi:hypothetical protein
MLKQMLLRFSSLDSLRLLVVLCLIPPLLLLQACQSKTSVPGTSAELRAGVLIDPTNSRIFLMRPDGSTEAIEVESGSVRWASDQCAKPLLHDGDRLLCQQEPDQPGVLSLAIFDVTLEGPPVELIGIELPQRIVASIDQEMERTFKVRVRRHRDDVYLVWTETRHPMAAVEALGRESTQMSGIHLIDMDAATYLPQTGPPVPDLFDLPSRDLLKGERQRRIDGMQFRSADDRHILTSRRVADNRTWDKYEWSIWERASAERVGSVRDFQLQNHFAVIGPMLLYELAPHSFRAENAELVTRPLSIQAVDLKTGVTQWRLPIRDTKYRGPLPP